MAKRLSTISDFMWRTVKGVVVPSFSVFLLGLASYWLFTRVLSDVPPGSSSTSDFKDALQTILALAAIAMGAFGLGVYKLLSQQVEERVARSTERRLRIANAIHKIDLGLVYWNFYLRSTALAKPDRVSYLDEAIKVTKEVYGMELAGMSLEDREVETLLLQMRNNWVYYIYEKDVASCPEGVEESEKQMALLFADFIDERKVNYTNFLDDFNETISKVRSRFQA